MKVIVMIARYKNKPKGNTVSGITAHSNKGWYNIIQRWSILMVLFVCIYILTTIMPYGQWILPVIITLFASGSGVTKIAKGLKSSQLFGSGNISYNRSTDQSLLPEKFTVNNSDALRSYNHCFENCHIIWSNTYTGIASHTINIVCAKKKLTI